jgi:hypothetical protein
MGQRGERPDRDRTIEAGVRAGKLSAGEVGNWRELWGHDPVGAQAAIGRLMSSSASDRDRVLDEAVAVGKFSARRRGLYERAWDQDPEATRALIGRMAAAPSLNAAPSVAAPADDGERRQRSAGEVFARQPATLVGAMDGAAVAAEAAPEGPEAAAGPARVEGERTGWFDSSAATDDESTGWFDSKPGLLNQ